MLESKKLILEARVRDIEEKEVLGYARVLKDQMDTSFGELKELLKWLASD